MMMCKFLIGLLVASSVAGTAEAAGKTYEFNLLKRRLDGHGDSATHEGDHVGKFKQAEYGAPGAPKRKTWWTKRLTNVGENSDRFYIGGQPSARDLKMLYEEGFSTVYSLWEFKEERMMGDQKLPTTADAVKVAEEAGLLYGVWNNGADGAWMSKEAVDHIEEVIDKGLKLPGPVYLHCYIGRTACQAMQAYRARKKIIEAKGGESVTAAAMRECGAHGVRFDNKAFAEAIAREAGEDFAAIEKDLPAVESAADLPDGADKAPAGADGIWWKGDTKYGLTQYHWLKYLSKVTEETRIFDAGQILKSHIKAMEQANIGVIVNMRKSTAAPEETNLLNIGNGPKQAEGRQDPKFITSDEGKKHIISEERPTSWISDANGEYNFESLNEHEFGDANGYSEAIERKAIEAGGIKYFHLPIGKNYTADALMGYSKTMIDAINMAVDQKKSILFHCRTGYRTGSFPTALRGVIEGAEPSALQMEMSQIGYDFQKDGNGKKLLDATADLQFCKTPDAKGHIKGFVAKKDAKCEDGPAAAAPAAAAGPAAAPGPAPAPAPGGSDEASFAAPKARGAWMGGLIMAGAAAIMALKN